MLKSGVALWNYVRDDEEHIQALARELHAQGFEAVSYNGREFSVIDDKAGASLAQLLSDTGMLLTVHYLLPDPDKPEMCEAFVKGIDHMAAWQRRYGMLHALTFDVWYDRKGLLPYLKYTLESMRGLNVKVCCEDFPLNAQEADMLSDIVAPEDDFGLLIDVGHMNLRQTAAGKHTDQDFVEAFKALPYPVYEVHLHDNHGDKDEHRWLGYGTLPVAAVAQGLKAVNFDGVVTVEIIQRDWSLEEGIAHAVDTKEQFLKAMMGE